MILSFYSWSFLLHEQDQFRGQEAQQVIPTCARHHPPACEPRITHISALVAEALMLCGYHNHPRLRCYINTISHVGGMYGYWCGCGALGFYDSDMPASEEEPDFDVRRTTFGGSAVYLSVPDWPIIPDCAPGIPHWSLSVGIISREKMASSHS